ncbi:hypothetical protein A2V54_03100 [candidate division WWE3 bacterium RBG_19FT_COMBO_53_11]|uniref:DUF5667 domain-containing protein n=1 Tax=candidate division WWE3 bacterium RBG_19FT_COMBO_53_11 TaxID=1802613 RepID=A0A1F4UJF1_UNCKA|nr:MAG: hypothetical protein A2155_02660 [candidate division WWE3 bacterium RBG_16_52_45]OGC44343.1 MAG: hypothetical protein A2V54_03100 [candidate division WWE3 bacterium RBG_19FT_COMBO_53_11]
MYLKAVFKVAKIAALTLLPLLVFIFLAGNIFAHEGEVDPYEDIEEAAFAPDSPFYFLRGWQEAIEGFIANFQGDEARANLELRFAERRVAEMKRLARLGEDGDVMERLRQRWEQHLVQAQERAEKMSERREEIQELILEQMDRHRTVMEKVLEQVPAEAQDAINRAIENYETNRQKLLERFSSDRLEEVKSKLKKRFESTIERFQLRRERFRDLLENGTDETTE